MFEFLKEDFKDIYFFIENQINPQVTGRLNSITSTIMGFVENRLREIKPDNINIYNKDELLISKTEKIGFVNFYHSAQFKTFMKNEVGFDLKNFNDMKVERNRSGSHIENLSDNLDDETIKKYYYTLFCFLKAYYQYKTQKNVDVEWEEEKFRNLFKKNETKIVEVEKIVEKVVEVEKVIEKKVVDTKSIKEKDKDIGDLTKSTKEKDLIINKLKLQNDQYKTETQIIEQQKEEIKNQYEKKLKLQNGEKNTLKKQLQIQQSINLQKEKEISDLQNQNKRNEFKRFLTKHKKKILIALFSFVLITTLTFSIMSIVYQSSNKLFFHSISGGLSVSIGNNFDDENLVIPATKDGKIVKEIVNFGNKGNSKVITIELPDTIEIIDGYAFQNFVNLKQVIIPQNAKLKKISYGAFSGCKSLTNFYIPANVNFIGKDAFANCHNLERVIFESRVDWCVDIGSGSTRNYQNIYLSDTGNNAQLLTSINKDNNWFKKFNLNFNLNGGSVISNPTFFTVFDYYTINNPTRTAYTFSGWTGTNINIPTKQIIIYLNSIGDRQYTANWTPIEYTITYQTDGGIHSNPTKYTIESPTITLKSPTKSNHKFLGWYTNSDFTGEIVTTIPQSSFGNISLFAKWTSEIIISNADEFLEFAGNSYYWGGNITLSSDIDLGGREWVPVGNYNNKFTGHFNGNGHVISNFKITVNRTDNGVFGYTYGATIENLGVENYIFSINSLSNTYCGVIVGRAYGGTLVQNCYTNSNISVVGEDSSFVGGIIGYSYNATVKNCYSTGNISVSVTILYDNHGYTDYACAGGIVGHSYANTRVEKSFSLGQTISAKIKTYYYGNTGYSYAGSICEDNCQELNNCHLDGQKLIRGTDTFYVSGADTIANIYKFASLYWDNTIWNTYTNQNPKLIKK